MKNDDLLIYGIREYFKACPLLRRGRLLIDALGLAPVSYSLDVLPCDPIITQYADGDSLRQYQCKESYTGRYLALREKNE